MALYSLLYSLRHCGNSCRDLKSRFSLTFDPGRRFGFARTASRLVSFTIFAWAGIAQGQNLIISEFMAVNNTTLADVDGAHSDWLEIYNAGAGPVNLGGWHLTDDSGRLDKWRFPNVVIPSNGYLVVFASDKNRAVAGSQLHLNFQLTSAGEYLALVMPDAITVAHAYSPAFPPQYADVSYGIVSGAPDYMTTPTPGAANIAGGLNQVAAVQFSAQRGFYNQPIQVSLSTQTSGAEIRYTLDGSTPTASSGSVYTAPVNLNQTTVLRAGAFKSGVNPSRVGTNTYIFISSVIVQTYPGGSWPPPGVIGPRNQRMDYDMDPEVVNDPRYSSLIDDALLAIPTLSLSTNPNHLFNTSTNPAIGGIYVNANEDGREWERPVSMELIHPDGSPGFQIDAGIRIRGGWSRGGENPKHAFRFFFRSEYGPSRLRYPLFGDEGVDSFDKIDLRCSTDYSWCLGDMDGEGYGSLNTQTRDVFCRDSQRDMGQPYTRSRQYHVYLNGLYWGMYQSQERSEASFAESYLGGNEADWDAINRRSHSEGAVDGNLEAWTDLYQKTIAGFTSDAAYYAVQGLTPQGSPHPVTKKLVDLDNLIDYMLVIYYSGSFDTPVSWWFTPDNTGVNNIWAVFNRANPDGFKYFCHDCEHTLLAHLKTYPYFPWSVDRTGPFTHPRLNEFDRANPQTLHQNLLAHPAYRKRFLDTVYKRFFHGGALTPAAATERFMARIQEIDLAIIAESARWGDAQQESFEPPRTKDDDFIPTVNGIVNEFFPTRTDVVLKQLKDRGWYPQTEPPAPLIDGIEQRGGYVANGGSLSFDNPSADGTIYYTTDGTDPWLEPSQRMVTTLVPESASKRVLVPSGPIADWNTVGFDDSGWQDGYVDGALEFDGVNDYVDCGTTPGSGAALTVAFWVHADVGIDAVLLDKYPSGSGGAGWRIRTRSRSRMQFFIGSGSSNTNFELQRTYYPNTWNHIAFTFEAGTIKVYVDGVGIETRTGISQSVQNLITPFRMGIPSAVETNLRFDGRLDDVRIYHRVLSSQEIADLSQRTHVPTGLVGQWKLDETEGTTANDSSGNNHHGSLVGGPTWRANNKGGVGYNEGEAFFTTITNDLEVPMKGQNPSAYVRIPFMVDAGQLANFQFMNLRMKYDAGFVAYLNGQKLAESGTPGTPEWNSVANAERGDEEAVEFRSFDVSQSIGNLVAGANLLAVQGLNSAANDEDFLMSVELVAQDLDPEDEISPIAAEYAGSLPLIESAQISARTLGVGEWSPLERAIFAVGPVMENLRITEIHYNPAGDGDSEFIELKNIGTETIGLNLVRFTNGIEINFPSYLLAPGAYVVAVADLQAFENVYGSGRPVAGVYSGRLNNGGERIEIADALGAKILNFVFSDDWRPTTDGGGYSLTFLDPDHADPADWGEKSNWFPSSVLNGTPGEGDPGPFETPTATSTRTLPPTPTATVTNSPIPSPTSTATPTMAPQTTVTETPPVVTQTATPTETETPEEGTLTPTPAESSQPETPTPTSTPNLSFDRTGEGDIDVRDLLIILTEPHDPDYLFHFANRWWGKEGD